MQILVHTCCGPCAIMPLSFLHEQKHEIVSFFYNPNIHPLKEYLQRREGAKQVCNQLAVSFVSADTLPFEEQLWQLPFGKDQPNKSSQHGQKNIYSTLQPSVKLPPPSATPQPAEIIQLAEATQQNIPLLAPLPDLPPTLQVHAWLAEANKNIENRCVFCWYSRLERTAAYAKKHTFDAFTTTLLYSRHQNHEKIQELAERVAKTYDIAFLYQDFRPMWQKGIARSKEMGIYRQQYCGCIFSEYDRYARTAQQIITP